MIEAGLIAARFLHVAAAMALFGLALFPFYSLPSRTNAWPAGVGRWLRASTTGENHAPRGQLVRGTQWMQRVRRRTRICRTRCS